MSCSTSRGCSPAPDDTPHTRMYLETRKCRSSLGSTAVAEPRFSGSLKAATSSLRIWAGLPRGGRSFCVLPQIRSIPGVVLWGSHLSSLRATATGLLRASRCPRSASRCSPAPRSLRRESRAWRSHRTEGCRACATGLRSAEQVATATTWRCASAERLLCTDGHQGDPGEVRLQYPVAHSCGTCCRNRNLTLR